MKGYELEYRSSVAGFVKPVTNIRVIYKCWGISSVSEQPSGSCKCFCSLKLVNYKETERDIYKLIL
jgi:hypothetical protein